MIYSRRKFIKTSGVLAIASLVTPYAADAKLYKAAVIGRTGGGDYGHGFDTIFEGVSNITVTALADADEVGRKAASARANAKRSYADYREMLRNEKPDLVSVASRVPDCHREMALAAIEIGAHLIIEKPITEHLNEADEIVTAAEQRQRKILVGHKNRYSSEYQQMRQLIAEGFLGRVLEMRVQGKQDSRVGGEDMIVLGTHDFDSMRFFFGDPVSCSASVFANGRPAGKADVKKGREPILVAGDTIRASFYFPENVLCTWHSVKADPAWHTISPGRERWGFTIFGTRRILSYHSGSAPLFLDSPFIGRKSEPSDWKPLPEPRDWPPASHQSHLVRNLLHAIERDEQPLCSGHDGRWAVEMVSAIYESHRTRSLSDFPLKDRTNPLLRM